MPLHIEEQGARKLAVALGVGGRGHTLAKLTSLRGSPGWLVREERVEEWRFEGFTERGGELLLYGPEVEGRTLAEALELSLADALPFIARLSRALSTLAERGVQLFPVASDAVMFTDDGGVLFLPPELMQELREVRPFTENRETFEALNHPDLRAEQLACFTLGVLAYRLAAGRFPFLGSNEEEMHEQARKLAILPPHELVAGFDREASDLVMASLGRLKGARAALSTWREASASWLRGALVHPVDAEERERVARSAAARGEEAAKRFRTRTFWEANWRRLAIICGVVLVVALVIGSILKGVFAARPTRGYTAQKVVETYFESINALNSERMQACVVDRAGQADINEVTNLYVISRVQMGYEGKSSTITADEWAKEGRPKLKPGTSLFGVTDLSLQELQADPNPIYLVTFVKWEPKAPEGATGAEAAPLATAGTKMVERIYLRRDRRFVDKVLRPRSPGDWVIYRIEQVSAEPVPPPEYGPAEAAPAPSATPLPVTP